MAEVWNPFDANNPVYKDLAKQTAISNKYWRIAGSIAVLMIVADQAGNAAWAALTAASAVSASPRAI